MADSELIQHHAFTSRALVQHFSLA